MVAKVKSTLELINYYYTLSKNKSNEYMPDDFIDYIVKNANESDNFVLNTPLTVTWDITRKCNLLCDFCSANAKATSSKNELSFDEDMKIVGKLIDANVIQVVLQGGEPFMKKGILSIIEKLVSNNIYVEIITNGTLLNEDMIKSLSKMRNEFIRIKVSLDGSCPQINDKIRGSGSFIKALNSIRLLKKYDIYVRIQSVVTNDNLYDIVNIYKLACCEKVNSFGFTPVLSVGRGINSIIPNTHDVIEQGIKIKEYELNNEDSIPTHLIRVGYIQNIPNINKLSDSITNSFFKGESAFLQHCTCGKSKMEIDCDGEVYTCAFLRYDEMSAGNIMTGNILEIWNNSKWDEFRKIRRNTKAKCKNCDLSWCDTGCSALAYEKSKNLNQHDPNCFYIK